MRIVLYAAVSSARDQEWIKRGPRTTARRAARRLYDRLAWRFADRFTAHPYHYALQIYSNRGDEAIRLVIERQLRSILSSDIDYEELAWGRLGAAQARSFDDGNTVIVVAGGGYYRFGRGGDVDPQMAKDADALAGTRCPVISFGTGVNQNILPHMPPAFDLRPSATDVLKEHFRHVAYCAVRDEFSRTVLQPYSRHPIDAIADPVFFLEPVPPPAPAADVLRVGVNVAFHGPGPMAVLANWIHAARDLLTSIERRYRARFTYFVHSDVEHGVVRLLRDSGLAFEVIDTDPISLANAYAKVDIHICQMMHSSIMSTRLAIPTLVVAYDRKHYSFFDRLGLPKFCIPVESASLANLTKLFDELVARRYEIRAHLMARRAALRSTQDAALFKVASTLGAISSSRRGVRELVGDAAPTAPSQETPVFVPRAAPAAARAAGRARR